MTFSLTSDSTKGARRAAFPEKEGGKSLLRRGEKSLDRFLEAGVRLRPDDHLRGPDLTGLRVAQAQEERRRAPNAGLLPVLEILADPRGVLPALEALTELLRVQSERLGVERQLGHSEGSLIRKQAIVHLPVLSLLTRAVGRLGRLERIRMQRLEGKVAKDVLQLPGGDVVPLDLRGCLSCVSAAEGALVVRELDQGEHGGVAPLGGALADADRQVPHVAGGGPAPFAQGGHELLKLLTQGTLLFLERIDLFLQRFEIIGLRKAALAGKDDGQEGQQNDEEGAHDVYVNTSARRRTRGAG